MRARLLYDREALYGLFRVEDRHVRSVHAVNGDPVYRDSCVEVFVEPSPGRGYLNFEFNAGGTALASRILDPTRTREGFRRYSKFSDGDYDQIRVYHSLPAVVEPERQEPTLWLLEFAVPFEVFEVWAGAPKPGPGSRWRGNLFKCADATSRPHWISWSPLRERNFHAPECFGAFVFG